MCADLMGRLEAAYMSDECSLDGDLAAAHMDIWREKDALQFAGSVVRIIKLLIFYSTVKLCLF